MPLHRVTLGDVAVETNVSVATVSRALAGDPQISDATQARVREAADRLGYVPNVAARSLVRQRSTTFGLMTPDVTDPIHGQVVTGFQRRAAASGYAVILTNGLRDPDTERRQLRELVSHQVAGVAAMGTTLPPREARALVAPAPLLLIGSEHLPATDREADPSRGCLRPDDTDGMRQVVEHLIALGHRRVAWVGSATGASHRRRLLALEAALAAARLPSPLVLLAERPDAEALRPVAAELRARRPDAAVCYDDQTALHLLDVLRAEGVSVPEQLSVVGFDDIPFARISAPRLTTVAQHAERLGGDCVDLLLAAAESGQVPKSRFVPVSLVVRETTALRTA